MLNAVHATFVQNVEHEFRTPLAIVMGYAEMLRDGSLGQLDDDQQRAVDRIASQAQRLRELIERVGTLLSATAGNFDRAPVDLKMVATAVLQARWPQAEAAGVRLAIYPDSDSLLAEGDSYHLYAAVDCLVENGIKFSAEGGEVAMWTYAEGDHVCLAVRDTGIGIAADRVPHLFDGFFQADPSVTRQFGGIGLGLTLANSVATAHGGRLLVDSALGEGSCFTLSLPRAVTSATPRTVLSSDYPQSHVG